MNIAKLNEIFARDGREAALASAEAAKMASWIIEKLRADQWVPGYKKPPVSIEDVIGKPLVRMRPRIGKTERKGGRDASIRRKKLRAEQDRQLRNSMKGK